MEKPNVEEKMRTLYDIFVEIVPIFTEAMNFRYCSSAGVVYFSSLTLFFLLGLSTFIFFFLSTHHAFMFMDKDGQKTH